MATEFSTGYIPRPWQAKSHCLLKRHNVLVFHRRGGKTVFAVNEMIDKALFFNKYDPETGLPYKNPQFAFVATTIGQVEKIAWKYFKEYGDKIPGVKFNNQKLEMTFPHPHGICTIFLFGAENIDTKRGIYLDGYVLDEYADMHPDARDKVLLPTLSDRKGWEIVIGTPKGENAFKEIYDIAVEEPDMYFSCLHKASETGIIDDGELKMLARAMSVEAYAQEYECDFNAAPSGKYYAQYIENAKRDGRVTSVPYDNSEPVTTYWDLGFNDSTTIWFIQRVGREVRVIDYYEEHGKGLEHYVKLLDGKPYIYAEHVLPHDANAHELSSGNTRVDYLINMGLDPRKIRVMPRTKNRNEDIHYVRQVIPKCWFDAVKCKYGLKALNSYERSWDSKKMVYSETPVHNWASHGADGFRQFAVDFNIGFGQTTGRMREEYLHQSTVTEYDILSDF